MAVRPLTDALSDLDRQLRRNAARALGEIGPEARSALPLLYEASKHEEGLSYKIYADAISKIEANRAN